MSAGGRTTGMPSAVRIGNCSGFYGDRHSAMREMLTGGDLDYLTGDYLAELTMLILGRDRMKHPDRGYAKTFLTQLEECLGLAHDRGVRIVANAGGLNPAGLADAVRALAQRLGVPAQVAHVDGDDLAPRAEELGLGTPLTANAYLGAWGIVDCLNSGAEIVVTGRVTDASVTVGPAAAHFGWGRTDYHQLAGAVVAGHVTECGIQATGGNFSFFTEIPDLTYAGFPLAEIHADGSAVITKHPGTGGLVSVDTVTAQLLYEVTGARYANPDVTARMDTIELSPDGADRVRISGVAGEPPPPTLKVSLNSIGGFRNAMTFVLTGLDIDEKAALVRRQLDALLIDKPAVKPAELEWTLARTDHADADTEEGQRFASLRGPRPGPGECRTPVFFGRSGIGTGQLSGLYRHRAARRRPGVRGVHAGLCRRRQGAAHRCTRRWQQRRDSLCHGYSRVGAGRSASAARAAAGRADPARAAGPDRRGPQRRQGRLGQCRRLGAHRGAVALAGQHTDRRAAQGVAARDGRSSGHPPSAAQPARGQLRRRRHPRPGRRIPGAIRPTGQGAG